MAILFSSYFCVTVDVQLLDGRCWGVRGICQCCLIWQVLQNCFPTKHSETVELKNFDTIQTEQFVFNDMRIGTVYKYFYQYKLFRCREWHLSWGFSFADDHGGSRCYIYLGRLQVAGIGLGAELALVAVLTHGAHVAGLADVGLSISTPSPLWHTLSYCTNDTCIYRLEMHVLKESLVKRNILFL